MKVESLNKTQEMILKQLQENTGRALCDSGDAYGRNWQRNQGKTWEDLTSPPVRVEAHVYKHGAAPQLEIMGTVNVGAWLEANLEYDDEMQGRYERWIGDHDINNDLYDMERMERFVEDLLEDGKRVQIHNSYNSECDLSQTIQFAEFEFDGETYVLLQVHGGCDVRGGYTEPVAYRVTSDYFGRWDVDMWGCDSKQWDEDFSDCNDSRGLNLKDYPVYEFVWEDNLKHDLECLKQTNMDNEETRNKMIVTAATIEREAFEEFCDALEEHSVVVYKRDAYFVGDMGAEKIFGDCSGLY